MALSIKAPVLTLLSRMALLNANTRALLFSSHFPKYHWDDAALTATFLINCLASRTLPFQTPLQVLHQTYNSSFLENNLPMRVFGCTTYVHLHHSSKLDPKAVRCIFLGSSTSQKGYKCFDPLTEHLFVTYDVTFHENNPFYSQSSIQGETWSEFQALTLQPEVTPPTLT